MKKLERTWIITAVVVIVVAGLALWLSFRRSVPGENQTSKSQSHTTVGQTVSVSGDKIQILGAHVDDTDSDMSHLGSRSYMTVTVTSDTKFVETVYPQISAANAAKLSNDQLTQILKSYTQAGSIDDLKKAGSSMTIKTTANTSASDSFSAAEIDYSTQKTVKP
ncbi:MAG TPA: hypothetical protein VFK07_01690 [Candidatus Paceibacterota bacterium]|nr:hypothetical protein [Candidatus Paceibacterota bacterium]